VSIAVVQENPSHSPESWSDSVSCGACSHNLWATRPPKTPACRTRASTSAPQVSDEVPYGLTGVRNSAASRADQRVPSVLVNQSKSNERSLDPQQGHTVVGGGDHLLMGLHRCFKQAIQFRLVTPSTSVRLARDIGGMQRAPHPAAGIASRSS
jgi:hypothetical protein